jgi:sugar/nucleoside kinase (ribokinase family)
MVDEGMSDPVGPTEVWTMGELLAEVMRPERGLELDAPAPFLGPFPSGAPGIFIDTVARLGVRAGIVGAVGDDPFGRCITDRLARDGVRIDHVAVVPGYATGVAFVAYAMDGSREFLFHWPHAAAVQAAAPPASLASGARLFHVMGCSLMADARFRGRLLDTMDAFVAAGARVSFDPNMRLELGGADSARAVAERVLDATSVLLPGRDELLLLAGESDLDRAAAALLERPRMEVVAVKLGRSGARVYTRGAAGVDVLPFVVEEVDPTGAGDCFDAAFVCGLLRGLSPADAARQGNAAGALNAMAFGPMEGDISRETVAALLGG